jgi:diaminopimelate decarboxylase
MPTSPYDRNPNGQLRIGPHPLAVLVERFGSPLYLYNFEHLREVYTRLRKQLYPGINLYYAIKANPNPSIIKQYIDLGAGFDVSSVGELRLALRLGAKPECMSFAGPGKQNGELEEAIAADIGMLSVESFSELASIAQLAEKHEKPVSITLRVNPVQKTRGYQIKMGGVPSPFGIDEECIGDCVQYVRRSRWLKIKGLHVFAGTQCLEEDAIVENTLNILRLADALSRNLDLRFEAINLGGGWGIPYHDGEKQLDEKKLTDQINAVVGSYLTSRPQTKFILELGRYLVASSALYVTTVVRAKQSRGARFLILDGGMNHYLAASGNLGQVFRKNFPLVHASKPNEHEEIQNYNVVGPLCTPIDRMGTDVKLPITVEGDILVFPLAGAYAYSASPLHFLSHPSPAEIAVKGEEVFAIAGT